MHNGGRSSVLTTHKGRISFHNFACLRKGLRYCYWNHIKGELVTSPTVLILGQRKKKLIHNFVCFGNKFKLEKKKWILFKGTFGGRWKTFIVSTGPFPKALRGKEIIKGQKDTISQVSNRFSLPGISQVSNSPSPRNLDYHVKGSKTSWGWHVHLPYQKGTFPNSVFQIFL